MTELRKLGLVAHTQPYSFRHKNDVSSHPFKYDGGAHRAIVLKMVTGQNVYAISSSARASGSEAIVISASWLSSIDEGRGTPNLRGVATVLSLAAFLPRECIASIRLAKPMT
jgi:GPI-anchor transamidase subunit GAA1